MKNFLTSRFFIRFLYHFARIYAFTFKLSVENEEAWKAHVERGGHVLLCTWHQQFFLFIRHFKTLARFAPGLMISKSKDGDLIAGVAKLSGWHPVRGSSSTGGRLAMNDMVEYVRKNGLGAHILDGPRGPAGIVKKGVIAIAAGADAMIVPVYAIAENAWFFKSWDRFMLPKPFSKVIIRYGDMIRPDRIGDQSSFEGRRKTLETIMAPALYR
ncbi:MAG: lysophospholipid acyltransferase family protein [Deltaproteobacteria bacterium]|nr:lysophospholipid acyltransferase family protein [Deltaproteobacteria bacterium]